MEQPLQALDVHSPDVRRADSRLNAYLGAEVSNAPGERQSVSSPV
jgi:hypothetical protein